MAADRKVDSRAMREVNRSIIYDLIRQGGEISRTDLAKISLLTKPTVSTIVEQLLEEGIVSEVGFTKSEPTGGRRARLLRFNPDSAAYLGLRFGVKSTTVALADGLGQMLAEEDVPAVLGDAAETVANARRKVEEILKKTAVPRKRLKYIGVAVSGLVEASTGNCVLSPNLEWKDVPLKALVEKEFKVPAAVFNVTEAAATAEARRGATREVSTFVWVYVGTGIGSAIFADGQVYRGRSGFAGEIGFCRTTADGPILEEIASGRAILATALSDRARCDRLKKNSTVDDVLQLAEEGDPYCSHIVEAAGAALGLTVAHLVNITNPELVVLGGGVAERSRVFVRAVNAAVQHQALGPEAVPVLASALSGHSVATGAVLLAMDHAVRSIRIRTTSG